jgi:hypothetical protein
MTGFPRPAHLLALIAIGMTFMPVRALACSCWKTASIGTALTRAEIVVVGRVVRQLDSSAVETFEYQPPVVVKVIDALKGDVTDEILISTDFMCYRSFDLDDMKPGETFVFPISHTAKSGVHILPSCSHSALKLVDGQLFTSEFIPGGGRRLDHYMSLPLMRFLLPWRVLDAATQGVIAAVLTLVIPMLVTLRVRKGSANATPVDQPPSPIGSLRSLSVRSIFAIVWMLVCGGFSIFVSLKEEVWLLWALGGVFAFTAAGVALRWRWSEGLSYGLALLWIGFCLLAAYAFLQEFNLGDDRIDARTVAIFSSVVLLNVAAMVWCADAVRRRFSIKRA